MSRTIDWYVAARRVTRQVCLVAGLLSVAGGAAFAQTVLPDAQVEANVLKALAGAPDLADESITTKTVYGTVTLSGSVTSEAARTRAENLTANCGGVKKVVDELQLGNGMAASASPSAGTQQPQGAESGTPLLLQSDGTYAPAPAAASASAEMPHRTQPDAEPTLAQEGRAQQPEANATPQYGNGQASDASGPPAAQGGAPPYPQQPGYPYPGRRPMYSPRYPGYTTYPQPRAPYAQGVQEPAMGGQIAGQTVTVPSGALLRVRMNRTLSSNRTSPGTTFDGVVVTDVVADGVVAIPRGATVQGTVLDTVSSGALRGRGEMSIQLTQVTLGGRNFPLVSDVWAQHGGDKTIETVNKTAGFGAAGALLGALGGRGVGAAVGGGVGAAVGLASSATSGRGEVFIPAESTVTFHTAQPAQVAIVSEQEMQRLAYGVPSGADQRPVPRTYRVYPGYYPPGYFYPGPYPPYGYPVQY